MTNGSIVVCGARGFVGTHLVHALTAQGHQVVCGSRSPDHARTQHPGWSWVELDVDRPDTLDAAFRGADTVVYLVHGMRSSGQDLENYEAQCARAVLAAAEEAGVRRIVYLGGPAPSGAASKHLAARLQTGEILRSGSVSTVELRASMIVGPGSESWLIVRDLALRLPVMVLPRWLDNRSQPIGIDDIVWAISHAISLPREQAGWYDLPGPEALSGRQILVRIAAQVGSKPLMIGIPLLTPSLSSHWIRLVTRADYAVARKLVDGLTCDLVAPDDGFWSIAPDHERVPFDTAVKRALAAEAPHSMSRVGQRLERIVRRLSMSAS